MSDSAVTSSPSTALETFTFTAVDNQFTYTVKGEFQKKGVHGTADSLDLMVQHEMANFLHNPVGPAIVHIKSGECEYWLNGKQLDEAESKKIEHDCKFNDKFDKSLED